MSTSTQELITMAQARAAADTEHAYTQVPDFQPHTWVWLAMRDAYNAGRDDARLASQPAEQPSVDEKTYVCSHCHGSGFGPDGKPCPVSHSYFVPKYTSQPKAATDAQVVAEVVDAESDDGYMIPKHARLIDRDLPSGTKLYTHPAPSQAVGAVDAKPEQAVGDGVEMPVAWRSNNPDAIKAGQKYSDAENSTYFWSVLHHGQKWPKDVTLLYDRPAPRPAVATAGDGVRVDEIVSDLCDMEPFDPDHQDAVCVNVHDLIVVLNRHLASPSAPRVGVPEEMIVGLARDSDDGHYRVGWNDCRTVMLAAAPEVPRG